MMCGKSKILGGFCEVCSQDRKYAIKLLGRKKSRVKYRGKGLCGTRPGSLLKNQILIRTDNWDIKTPGFMEADTVVQGVMEQAGDIEEKLPLELLGFDPVHTEQTLQEER